MDQADAELARRLFDRWNSGDREISGDEVDSEAEIRSALTGLRYRGHDGIRTWMREIDDQFHTWRTSADDFEELPDGRLLVVGHLHAKGRGSGIELDSEAAWILEFRASRVLRMEIFLSHAEARAAVAGA